MHNNTRDRDEVPGPLGGRDHQVPISADRRLANLNLASVRPVELLRPVGWMAPEELVFLTQRGLDLRERSSGAKELAQEGPRKSEWLWACLHDQADADRREKRGEPQGEPRLAGRKALAPHGGRTARKRRLSGCARIVESCPPGRTEAKTGKPSSAQRAPAAMLVPFSVWGGANWLPQPIC